MLKRKSFYRLLGIFQLLLLLSLIILPSSNQVFADTCSSHNVTPTTNPAPIPEGVSSITITFSGVDAGDYRFRIGYGNLPWEVYDTNPATSSGGTVALIINDSRVLGRGSHVGTLLKGASGNDEFCGDVTYKVGYEPQDCRLRTRPGPNTLTTQQDYQVDVFNSPAGNFIIQNRTGNERIKLADITIGTNGQGTTGTITGFTSPQTVRMVVFSTDSYSGKYFWCDATISVNPLAGGNPVPIPPPAPPGAPGAPGGGGIGGGNACSPGDPNCAAATGKACNIDSGNTILPIQPGKEGILTALGCVPTNPQVLITRLMVFAGGIAGAIALILMIMGAVQMLTSGGNPEQIKKGRDQFVSAIIGLVFIIFSVTLLQILGVDILNIPGFTK